MNIIKIDYQSIKNTDLFFSWADLKFGIERKYIDIYDAVKLAEHYYSEGREDDLTEKIAQVLRDEYDEIMTLFSSISFKSQHELEISNRKWLYCTLFLLLSQKESVENVFEIIEIIYSDFDYPEAISGLVRYMPTDKTYKTIEEYNEEIMKKWEVYLVTEKGLLNEESID